MRLLFKVFVAIACCLPVAAGQAHAQAQINVGYFGDSTTYGEMSVGYPVHTLDPCQPVGASYPKTRFYTATGFTLAQRLGQLLSGMNVIDQGVPGRRAADMVSIFGGQLDAGNYDMVILNYGINDARAPGQRSVAEYVADMKALVDQAVARGIYVVIEKPTPIRECVANQRLEEYRAALNAFSSYENVRLVDQGLWQLETFWWRNLLSDILHPNAAGYERKAQTLAAAINAMPKWCTLVASSNLVPGGAPFSFKVRSSYLSGVAPWSWYGTKNGVADAVGAPAGTVPLRPWTFAFTNSAGWEGTYTRRLQLNFGGNLCTTNTVTVQLLPSPTPTCQLTVDKGIVPANGSWTFTALAASLPGSAPHVGRWHGTKNGVVDAVGTDAMAFPSSATYTSAPGLAGTYSRYLKVYDAANNLVCTTNSVGVLLQ
ncbi:MAG: SGNH/GDSL hydrolase family protein [Kofleriaceae bacterium]|jgi:lysophospholipase L1-like esterase|nr:SGNH/GDSL hydrolase family protein [Kofleriaceae bacterium]MBP9167492.1 SGNH/GDSL hydrolase family protein [Kofleriaceae bacterium]MBP9856573.1 SGNH/GDSL hydrolase family protein [Kofleriaceae bacterium]